MHNKFKMGRILQLNCSFLPISCLLLLFLFHHLLGAARGLPLSTESRWIVDEKGWRVKLACVNWVSHLDVVVAEGLSKQPVDEISKKIVNMGFNCVRLTWPIFLATNDSLANLNVKQSFMRLGLSESISGLQANNPSIADLTLINAFQEVVESLVNNKVMVILDNHISKPGWCCNNFDGNGFFGDQYFNPDLWIMGLTKMATLFKDNPYVVGMSLRNELRGPKQNVVDWYRYMQRGAEAVHEANPNVLVILSGLSYDRDFTFLGNQTDTIINLTFTGKLVFEMHWYGFSDGQAWIDGNPNQVCGSAVNNNMRMSGFLLEKGFPLLVSEFGMDLRGTNVNDNRYFNCFLAWVAEYDLDWALWTLVGSYYFREGVVGMNEYYGLLDWNWSNIRNTSFLDRISVIQSPFQGPGVSETKPHKILFHPSTGHCILKQSLWEPLKLGNCSESSHWDYTPQKRLTIQGTYTCLLAQGLYRPVRLSFSCAGPGAVWESISDSKLHLATTMGSNSTVCLDVDFDNNIIATSCKCLGGDNMCDPGSQWFKIVDANNGISASILAEVGGAILGSHLSGLLRAMVQGSF